MLLLSACGGDNPADPMCRINQNDYQNISADAACVITVNNHLLTLSHNSAQGFTLPGGNTEEGESAQCTAHRHTWQNTGFNVEVGRYLGELRGIRHYQCTLAGDFSGELTEFPVPDWASSDIDSIQLVDPYVTTHQQWQHADELVPIRDMFTKAQD